MKNKPTRHKETNTFQFKPFSERISEIDVDVFHRVAHRNEENDEEIETHFHQTLEKWNYLNLTEGYCSFKKKVRDVVTLPQLLNKKQFVIDTLIEYLRKKDVLFVQPILELLVAVAKDLQKEFYEYFPEFLSVLVELLQTKDTEQIEYTFTTLAYLFKFLWRYLVKHVQTIFDLLLPLLASTQPAYINNFAAESFSFVVRKVKDKKSFIKLVLEILENSPTAIAGCGKLLFEVIYGTPGQFHSCAEQILPLYFNALQDKSVDQALAYKVLTEIVNCILQNIHPHKTSAFWNILLDAVDLACSESKDTEESSNRKKSLVLVLRLLSHIIKHKNGRMLTDPMPVVKKVLQIMGTYESDHSVLEEHINVLVAILLASNVKLMQETSSQVLLKIMTISNIALLHTAVESLIEYSSFETLVLPHIVRHSVSVGIDSKVIELFAKIIKVKSPPSLNGIMLQSWKKYILDIRGIQEESNNYLLQELKTLLTAAPSIDALRILLILPHLKPLSEDLKTVLKEILYSMYNKLQYCKDSDHKDEVHKLSFTFLLVIQSAVHIFEPDVLHDVIHNSDINLTCLYNYSHDKTMLNVIDLLLTHFSRTQFCEEYINETTFDALNNNIVQRVGSAFGSIRLIATHLYSLFANVKELASYCDNPSNTITKNAMELVYLAETEPVTVHKYRDRLLHLQSLTFQSYAISSLNSKYYEFPLRYLLGNLYINFSLLWDPVSKIIASYANKDYTIFWSIFLSELKNQHATDMHYKPLFKCEIISGLEEQVEKLTEKPDYNNQKLLLWKCMLHFIQMCEVKNRDLTGMFIDFVNDNFFKSNSEDAKYCSITKHTENTVDENMEDDSSDEKEEKINHSIMNKQFGELNKNYKIKLLIAQMEIFDKIQNPKMLYREAEMRKIYLDLLSSRNPDIQKAALNCLFSYKHKYLLAYKEHLYNLIAEKNLKNELALFKIDQESKMIQEEHRNDFIPILMRIIYAKMVMKTGMRTGGKSGGLQRRKIVLRFLAGTQENEMMVFAQMAFKPFKRYASLMLEEEMNLKQLIDDVVQKIDLDNVIPPKRLQSAVNLLSIIIEQFGAKMSNRLLPRLLGMLICILADITGILQQSDHVHSGYLPSIRNIRTSCISILARFFSHFEDYAWQEHEIDALFNVAVFPWIEKLPIEGIHSPTALLKLFMAWGQNSRYFPLFIKHHEKNKSLTPLPYVMQLLLGPKTHLSVSNAILEIIEKMLTLRDYEKSRELTHDMDVDTPLVPLTPVLTNLLEIDETYLSKGVNYGSTILLPYVPNILEYMKNKLRKCSKSVNKIELVILSRISEFVTDGAICDTLLTLILPILVKKATYGENEETIVELITTVINLIKHVEKPQVHIRSITPLLGAIFAVDARKLLMQLYSTIAERCSEDCREILTRNCNLLISLNAWDSRWIDQPDFQKRIDSFKEINTMLEENIITLEFGVAIIYNCFYFLKTDSDLAIRDCSGQCLKQLVPTLAKQYKSNTMDRRYLMDETILNILRKGIISKNEAVRLQSISLLGHMALECAEVHPILRDLSALANKADPEVDFFENMQHLQIHRRARALLKFCATSKTFMKAPNPKTLTQFILPLASSYLCNETYAHKNNVVDAAIETIATICKLLPWHHYEIILKYYLGKLRGSIEFQKQLVRLLVAILDSFHYDLSKYKSLEGVSEAKHNSSINESKVVAMQEELKDENAVEGETNGAQEEEEKLDEALNNEILENAEDIFEEKNNVVLHELPVMERHLLLSQYGARRVIFSITNGLLPQLNRSIVTKTRHDNSHKINRKRFGTENEEEELMRVPIALALVKLLQKLPEKILDSNLPGILMKLCTFLKSRLESVRRCTREILQKIMVTLGPKYLHHLLREMNTLLTKGFQIHVLAFTVQSVLVALKPHFQKFDINNNLQSILSVCKVDLFGLTAEEKEIIGITKNVSEAKSTKSFDIFHILAEFITESCLLDLILPLKDVLMRTHSYKTVQKVVECLRNIVLGIADNAFIPMEQILIFLYGIISESIPDLMPDKRNNEESETKEARKEKPDCYIIPAEPKNRMGIKAVAKTTKNANAHVLIEFGLKLCHVLLKREKISSQEFKPYIEPFVPLLSDCLKSQHVKLSTLSLQCLNWILKMDLAAVKELISTICTSIFNILHKYAAAGLSKGDNFDLVMASFKCMGVIVRDVKDFEISAAQLKILILYAEQDLHDNDRQATAFTLLKAIISRKMIVSEMHPVMEKVAMLSITSELEHVRHQSRSVFYTYLMEYPLEKQLDKHIYFYLTQLSYEMQPGRLSALELIHNIITGFPIKALTQRASIIFLMTGARLLNDEDPSCRKLAAKCIKELVVRMSPNEKSKLFDIVLEWLRDPKITHRTLAAQLCGIFVTVEKDGFHSRLQELIPILLKQFYANTVESEEPGKFVKLQSSEERKMRKRLFNIKDPERMQDHHLFQVMQLLLKICANCSIFLEGKEYKGSVRSFAEYSQSLLAHPHTWVRLAATQMIGFILSSLDIERVTTLLNDTTKCDIEDGYVYSEPVDTLRSLTLDLLGQLQPDTNLEELSDQVVKNLIFIARILKSVTISDSGGTTEDRAVKGKDGNHLSLSWLVRRLRKAINIEITQAPKSTSVRTAAFKWIAGVVATVPMEYLNVVLFNIMSPLVREMSNTDETNTALRRLAKEVATMIKKRVGSEEYIGLLSRVQQKLDVKKAERKKIRTQQYVTDPELAAKRKISRQQKKKEARKRKLDAVRGKKVSRKRIRKESAAEYDARLLCKLDVTERRLWATRQAASTEPHQSLSDRLNTSTIGDAVGITTSLRFDNRGKIRHPEGHHRRRTFYLVHSTAMLSTVILAIVALILVFVNALLKWKKKDYPPGPFPWPFIGNRYILRRLTRELGAQHLALLELSKRYDSAVIAFKSGTNNMVVISGIKQICETLLSEDFDGRPWTEFIKIRNMGMRKGITMNDGEDWKNIRTWTVRAFKKVGFGTHEMSYMIKNELDAVLKHFKAGGVYRMQPVIAPAVINVLWTLATGKRISEVTKLQYLFDLMHRRTRSFDMSGGILSAFPWLRYIAPNFSGYNVLKSLNYQLKNFLMETVKEHKKKYVPGSEADLIDMFLREMIHEQSNPDLFTDEQLAMLLFDLFIAGSVTTTATLDFLFMNMVVHQDAQRKVHEELDSVVTSDRLPDLNDRPKLSYLEAVLTESMRMWTVTPIIGPRRALRDTKLDDYRIAKDAIVLINIYALNMNPDLFPSPETFLPERYMKDGSYEPDGSNHILFGRGSRRCPGEVLARSAVFFLFAGIMKKYNLLPVPNKGPFAVEAVDGLTLSPKPYEVILVPR
ncbi:hypothetical protein KM043_017437 [Ampulex compressa]|nr:hypothetical protein KM043_017437 [Ampulex compressa]